MADVGFPPGLLAGIREKRVQVDSQPASYEDCLQFRFSDEFTDVDYTAAAQIVYRIDNADPINVIQRSLNIATGGRRYRVYRDADVTFTGTLSAAIPLTPMNYNKQHGITYIPESLIDIRRADGAGILSGSGRPESSITLATDGNVNRSSSVYSPGFNQFGIAANSRYWIVMDHFGANNNTNGELELIFERRMGEL